MHSSTATETHASAPRGRKGHKGRGGQRGTQREKAAPRAATDQAQGEGVNPSESVQTVASNVTDDAGAEGDICFICAEPVKYWSLSECNHRTCHVCALRLRALYQKHECTFCKAPQTSVIFTKSPDALWSSYTPDMIPYKDPKLSIFFETQEMMEETLILLRFNCPDPDCDYVGNGWSDLKLHTHAVHGKVMCDLCIRFKKIFTHEHALYTPAELLIHLPSMQRGHVHNSGTKQQIEGGVHPLCEFCRECFFGDDELYAHMRERHEECFICKRNEIRDQYFRNYGALEQHFIHAHHRCTHPQCLAQKFVVFGSALDLKAHMVEEHGAQMSSRDRKDARHIEVDFEFEEAGMGNRWGRRDRRDREREREPPPSAPTPPGPSRPNGAGGRRREAFGGNLTTDEGSSGAVANLSLQASGRQSRSPPSPKSGALVSRINALALHPVTALPAIQAAVRSYRVSESAARDLISTIWNILDRDLDGTASIINVLVDLIDEEDKNRELLTAWNNFKIEQRAQFPELVPTATGSGWSGVASGRVLNVKHSTATRSSSQSSRQLWDRVARAAGSSSSPAPSTSAHPPRPSQAFPPLQPSAPAPSATPFRQPQRQTPWTSSAAAAPVVRGPTSIPGPGANVRAKAAPVLSKSAFPELPGAKTQRPPRAAIGSNQSLKRILGESTPAVPAWGTDGQNGSTGAGGSGTAAPVEGPAGIESASPQPTGGKGKKGKGKQKQTLFTLGSFPT
ncbi:uncharacterized protein LAESUDRAFT_646679 [Laetiporus sulphureus 93-53]|uniref:RING-type E3 ubiquitin transferase n=1 Tax=Laetiporus sulphureus 93-53 TaxID=1314785 RepID=A0A165G0R8_9APHY|nr:uncharacterized protein LAESUDRAFT_646679 [Laetiporus sulphureus 93-53]KZT09676.1 hypothetical protein LAESUDRAFT_646679 [Laetiporus sulphureus 93-53]